MVQNPDKVLPGAEPAATPGYHIQLAKGSVIAIESYAGEIDAKFALIRIKAIDGTYGTVDIELHLPDGFEVHSTTPRALSAVAKAANGE